MPGLFGGGESISPSNTKGEKGGINLPRATFFDNVRAQHKLVTEHFGIEKIYAVIGRVFDEKRVMKENFTYHHLSRSSL